MQDMFVESLINKDNKLWRKEVIESTFTRELADRILLIPLGREFHPDQLIWGGESSGVFFIRSTYKLLQ